MTGRGCRWFADWEETVVLMRLVVDFPAPLRVLCHLTRGIGNRVTRWWQANGYWSPGREES